MTNEEVIQQLRDSNLSRKEVDMFVRGFIVGRGQSNVPQHWLIILMSGRSFKEEVVDV